MSALLVQITHQLRSTSITRGIRPTYATLSMTRATTISTTGTKSLSSLIISKPELQKYHNHTIIGDDVSPCSFLPPTQSQRSFTTAESVQHNLAEENVNDDGTVIAVGPDGEKYAIPLKPLGYYKRPKDAPKLKPHIKNARIAKLRSVDAKRQNIRHSPWRLNLVCQFAAGQTVPDALLQLQYCEKVKAPLVASLIKSAANKAKQKYGLELSQLEVAECFATHGTHLKRIKPMGRGRAGKMKHRFSHMRVVLREIDFPLKILTCTSNNQRNQWIKKMDIALQDKAKGDVERIELEKLEKEFEAMQKAKEESKK